MGVEVIRVSGVEQVREAAHLFDQPMDEQMAERFLASDGHHLLTALVEGRPAGFAKAMELVHPDKPEPEMYLAELAVDPEHRGKGIASAIMDRLVRLCAERGCGGMFVMTDERNEAGKATYGKAGGAPEREQIMYLWRWPR